ncbi:MAG: GNAT family N-acetyltransferase [Gemmatimonadaceae bacterium]|nr:GNAT family N-acetyltransferase [Gemmatimonadaceae bacterium]
MSAGFTVRDATAADSAAVLALNNAAVPHVNALTPDEFTWIVERAGHYRVAEDSEGVAGFVLCIPSGLEYWSANYKWFAERYDSFLYLDRVVVAPRLRRAGVGRAMYEDLHKAIARQWPRVALEVNLRPPNPVSIDFHQAMRYAAVGVREYDDGDKAVQMFVREF